MAHVGIPFLVILVLCWVSTAPIINCGSVGIGMEDIDVSKPSTHFDTVVACTTISAFPFLAVFLWSRVCAYALWPILQASIVVILISADFDTPKNEAKLVILAISIGLPRVQWINKVIYHFNHLLTTLVCCSWSYWIPLQWAVCLGHYSCSGSIQCMSNWKSGSEGSDGHPLSSHLHTRNFHPQSKPCCTCQQWFLLGDVHSCKCIGSPLVGLRKQTQSHCKMLCIWNREGPIVKFWL